MNFFVIEGNCTCNDGYGGSDCSFDVSSPATITRLSGDGVCDKSSESCDDITLYGDYFLENTRTSCYVTRREVKFENFFTLTKQKTILQKLILISIIIRCFYTVALCLFRTMKIIPWH